MEELTIDEIESKYSTIRDPPVVNRHILSHDGISQRHKVPYSGTCPEILQVWSNGSVLTTFREVFELLFGRVGLRIQFLEVSTVEPPADGFVDICDHRVIPELRIFL